MKLPIIFGRRQEPAEPLSPAAEVERVEDEIARLRREAADARAEAEQAALGDPERAVTLDSAAAQATQLAVRLRQQLPRLYQARREAALEARSAEISAAVEAEEEATREHGAKVREHALRLMTEIFALRHLTYSDAALTPYILNGGKVVNYVFQEPRLTLESFAERFDSDLAQRLARIAAAGEALKATAADGRERNRTYDISGLEITRSVLARLSDWQAPPAEPEPEIETQPATAAGQ